MKSLLKFTCFLAILFHTAYGQIVERARPSHWNDLVLGGRFIDRFLPMHTGKTQGGQWGADGVQMRYVDNGMEDNERSYWGGNIVYDSLTNLYNLFVCGWDEKSSRGHFQWPRSTVYHAVSKQMQGPYKIKDTIGQGHNPELFRAKDGTYVLYVIDKRYTSSSLNGPWKQDTFRFDQRDRKIIEGLSNLTFAKRQDGSYLMVCRGGGIWFSQDGLSTFNQVTDRRVYPNVAGEFEDPVVWRDQVQYHLIVNDWLGRIAFYLRSKDGVYWVTDPGEAYTNHIAVHEDGSEEKWFKFERMKIFQDEYGRAIQANFAVIDVLKNEDKGGDNHSSKNITIPLNPGMLITMLNDKMPDEKTKTITIRIQAEPGFNPLKEIDVNSLRFGASEKVNFGEGCKVLSTKVVGRDLIVTFDARGHGITKDEFAPKLIGRSKIGKLIYGYTQVPWLNYHPSILSARKPTFSSDGKQCSIEIANFGEASSEVAVISLFQMVNGESELMASGNIQPLRSFDRTNISLTIQKQNMNARIGDFKIVIKAHNNSSADFTFRLGEKE